MTEYQQYVRLVSEACHASEAVDDFDVHSEDPISRATFQRLLTEQTMALLFLAQHVKTHADAIIAELSK